MADAAIEILLAEDNAEDAEMTMRALRRNNLANQLHWAKDGASSPRTTTRPHSTATSSTRCLRSTRKDAPPSALVSTEKSLPDPVLREDMTMRSVPSSSLTTAA